MTTLFSEESQSFMTGFSVSGKNIHQKDVIEYALKNKLNPGKIYDDIDQLFKTNTYYDGIDNITSLWCLPNTGPFILNGCWYIVRKNDSMLFKLNMELNEKNKYFGHFCMLSHTRYGSNIVFDLDTYLPSLNSEGLRPVGLVSVSLENPRLQRALFLKKIEGKSKPSELFMNQLTNQKIWTYQLFNRTKLNDFYFESNFKKADFFELLSNLSIGFYYRLLKHGNDTNIAVKHLESKFGDLVSHPYIHNKIFNVIQNFKKEFRPVINLEIENLKPAIPEDLIEYVMLLNMDSDIDRIIKHNFPEFVKDCDFTGFRYNMDSNTVELVNYPIFTVFDL